MVSAQELTLVCFLFWSPTRLQGFRNLFKFFWIFLKEEVCYEVIERLGMIVAKGARLPLSRFDRRSSYWYTSLPSKIRKILWKVALGNVCFFICCLRVCFDSKVPNKEFWKKTLKIAFLADFSITLIKGLYLFLLWAEDGREKLSQRGGTILSHNFLSGQP